MGIISGKMYFYSIKTYTYIINMFIMRALLHIILQCPCPDSLFADLSSNSSVIPIQ